MVGSGHSTRGVILDPAGPDGDRSLEADLERRGWTGLVRAADPYHAMVELCLQERARRTRTARGEANDEPTILVASATSDHAGMDAIKALLRAMKGHLPAVAVWIHLEGALRRLHAGGAPGDTRPETSTVPIDPDPGAGGGPPADLRLAVESEPWPDEGASGPAPHETGPTAGDAPPLEASGDEAPAEDPLRISPEEIEMLLTPDPREEPAP